MPPAKIAVWVLLLLMAAALTYGFGWGDFRADGRVITSVPWGIVSLVDVYVGFTLFGLWIFYRERSAWRSVAWLLAVYVGGNLVACLYALLALHRSAGDWRVFWMGRRAK